MRGTDGPWVLFIHGWAMTGAVFDPLWQRLDRSGLARVDLRGAGESDRAAEGHTVEQYGRDVLAWMTGAGIARATLVGHSMGGQVAQWMAAEAPDRVAKLVLLNPVPASGLPLPDEVHGFFRGAATSSEVQAAIIDQACLELPSADRERLVAIGAAVSSEAIAGSLEAWVAGGFAERLASIAAETHVIGTSDPFLPPELLMQAVVGPIRHATFHHLDGPGHYPMWEAPERTAQLVGSLL